MIELLLFDTNAFFKVYDQDINPRSQSQVPENWVRDISSKTKNSCTFCGAALDGEFWHVERRTSES